MERQRDTNKNKDNKGKTTKNNALLILANANPYHELYARPNIEALRNITENKELQETGKLIVR